MLRGHVCPNQRTVVLTHTRQRTTPHCYPNRQPNKLYTISESNYSPDIGYTYCEPDDRTNFIVANRVTNYVPNKQCALDFPDHDANTISDPHPHTLTIGVANTATN